VVYSYINVLFLIVVQKEKKVDMHCPRHSWPISELFSEFVMSTKNMVRHHIPRSSTFSMYKTLIHNMGHLPQPTSKYYELEYSVRWNLASSDTCAACKGNCPLLSSHSFWHILLLSNNCCMTSILHRIFSSHTPLWQLPQTFPLMFTW